MQIRYKQNLKLHLLKIKVLSGEGQEQLASGKVISEDQAVTEFLNIFFINIVLNFKISTNHSYETDFLVTNDEAANALNKFRNHRSIIMIRNKNWSMLFLWSSNIWQYIWKKQIILTLLRHLSNLMFQLRFSNKTHTILQDTFVEISTSVFRNQYSHQI